MAKRDIVATIVLDSGKYMIEGDAMIDVTLKSGVTYENVRVIGMNQMSNGIRVVAKDGINDIPTKLIQSIKDSGEVAFSKITRC